jgi:serine/threonine protein kinase
MGFFKKSEVKKHYDIGDQLGSGNFAVVKKATKREKHDVTDGCGTPIPVDVAIKIIDKSKVEDMNDIQREIEIMSSVSHHNVIKLYEIFDEPKKMHLVMELVTGGELFDRIVARGNYTEKDAAALMGTLCDALDYLHEKNIVHRDLKPENFLYSSPADDAIIKVADFGLARVVSGKDMMKTACGTPGYVAPEILQNKGYDSGAVDVWSAGVILYILLCGFPPFYEEELPALFDQILHARFDFPSPWWDNISKEAKDLVKAMLTIKPKDRITAKEVTKVKWIQTTNATDLSGAKAALKKYNASRKLKKAALGIMAQQKMEKAVTALQGMKVSTST